MDCDGEDDDCVRVGVLLNLRLWRLVDVGVFRVVVMTLKNMIVGGTLDRTVGVVSLDGGAGVGTYGVDVLVPIVSLLSICA